MKGYSILIVDDEVNSRQLMEAILVFEGYNATCAKDGKSAIALADQSSPDLMLIDVMMPVMNGFELIEHFRKTEKFKYTPILIVTALEDRDSINKGLNSGANDVITKPYEKEEILKKIKSFLPIKL